MFEQEEWEFFYGAEGLSAELAARCVAARAPGCAGAKEEHATNKKLARHQAFDVEFSAGNGFALKNAQGF